MDRLEPLEPASFFDDLTGAQVFTAGQQGDHGKGHPVHSVYQTSETMKIIRSTDRGRKRRSAHGEPAELVQRSEALEVLEGLERLDPGWECELSQIVATPRRA